MRNFGRPFTPEDGSIWLQTLGKRVSDDPRHFIFRLRDFFSGQHFDPKMYFCSKTNHLPLFGELRQTSQDLFDSDSDSNVSWDVCFNSLKSGFLIFGRVGRVEHVDIAVLKFSFFSPSNIVFLLDFLTLESALHFS